MWIQIRAYPDRRVDLCYWRELDKTVHTIADFSTNLWHSRPVEYEGRMYWFDYETPDSGSDGEKWNVDRLMSANLDGSDRRIVSSLIPIRRTAQSWGFDTFSGATIKIYHGSMYCIFQPTTAKLSSQYEGAYLCRIHPERAEPVDILYALPNGASQIRFDEGYLYFALAESTRSAWARLTSDAANVESAYTLCRVKVPN